MNDNNRMFEPRTIIALAIAFAGIFGWQYYLNKKYPQPVATATASTPTEASALTGSQAQQELKKESAPTVSKSEANAELKQTNVKEEKFFEVKTENYTLAISSHGMGFKNVVLNKYTDRLGQKVVLGDSSNQGLFSSRLTGSASSFDFDIEKINEFEYKGFYKNGDLEITRTLKFDKENYSVQALTTVKKPTEDFKNGFEFVVNDKIVKPQSNHFLFPSYDHQDYIVKHQGKAETINYSMAKEDLSRSFSGANLFSFGSQYFTGAIVDKSDLIPEVFVSAKVAEGKAFGGLRYLPTQLNDEIKIDQIFYFGPKKVEPLRAVDADLVETLNYGMFSVIAHPMLSLMKFFFNFTGNWGLAIILLTLIVRFIVLPFNLFSFKSMKAMQKIQPLLKDLREKYKNDPMALNRETMALMKQHNANPLSGCLPMLLQIPIFFALYRVIASSVEIYQQPFIGWITDLSLHDKFFVLPILMGVTMYVQQKITPSTMDPAQAKVMAFMPILFTGLMIYLPSGLTLYMFVSSLFGIIQQYYFMKEKKTA